MSWFSDDSNEKNNYDTVRPLPSPIDETNRDLTIATYSCSTMPIKMGIIRPTCPTTSSRVPLPTKPPRNGNSIRRRMANLNHTMKPRRLCTSPSLLIPSLHARGTKSSPTKRRCYNCVPNTRGPNKGIGLVEQRAERTCPT